MKRILLLLCAAVLLLSLAACGKSNGDTQTTTRTADTKTTTAPEQTTIPAVETTPVETEPTEPPQSTEAPQPAPEEDWRTAYSDLVNDFRKLIAFRMDPEFGQKWNSGVRPSDLSKTLTDAQPNTVNGWYEMILELPYSDPEKGSADYGYILHDLNEDGTPELFWTHKDHTICAIFTYHQSSAVLLSGFWPRYDGFIGENNLLYTHGSGGAESSTVTVFTLQDGSLTEVFSFYSEPELWGTAVNYYCVSGEITTVLEKEQFDQLYESFPHTSSDFWLSLPVVPLTEAPTEYVSAPIADQLPYTVNIPRKDFSVWSGPGYDHGFVDTVRVATTYTIVAEVPDLEGNLWGLLKSGLGWMDLTLLQKEQAEPPVISVNFADADQVGDQNNHQYRAETPGTAFTVYIYETVTDMTFCPVYYEENLIYEEPLFSLDTWTPDKAFVADVPFPGDMSMYAVRFTDSSGTEHTWLIGISGRNGSLYLTPAH